MKYDSFLNPEMSEFVARLENSVNEKHGRFEVSFIQNLGKRDIVLVQEGTGRTIATNQNIEALSDIIDKMKHVPEEVEFIKSNFIDHVVARVAVELDEKYS